ncbi:MAG TPA: cadherin domain-containing protein, partial [Thermoanaerobaculia bacterium]|nr:cadherin domain-containing protein [Thermoanaerobaculia bacterium]
MSSFRRIAFAPAFASAFASACAVLLLAFAAPAAAIEHQVSILLDLDNDAGTGCSVTTVDGPFDGVEQILVTTVETTSPPPGGEVTEVALQECIDPLTGTFGAPVVFDNGDWPIGVDNGVGGRDVVETYVELGLLDVPALDTLRLGVVVRDELGNEEALLTVDDTPTGAPILLGIQSVTEIPTLTGWGLFLLCVLLSGAAVTLLGRRGAVVVLLVVLVAASGVVWAAGSLDGLIDDWAAGDLLASNGMFLFGKRVGDQLCFRVDVELLFDTAPTADPQSVTTDEDTPVAITLTGSDPEGDPLTFTIVPGSGPTNGVLTGTPPDVTYTPNPAYEGPDSFDFQVEDLSGATDTATVSITVTGVNDPPVVDAATFTVAENSAAGTAVGTVTFTDPDAGQSHVFAITAGNTGGAFAIDPTTGEITVATPAAVDFETTPSFGLTVEVTDDGVPPLTGSATVTVDLTDVNDAPVVADQSFSVAEDAANGTVVGTVAASDQDLPAQTLSFAITGGNTGGAFAIDPSSGEITVANETAIDFETTPSFALTVEVTDDGVPPQTTAATATITVTDVNEAPVPAGGPFSIDENSANGTSVGTVAANDPDAGQTHSFAITAGNTGGAFAIGAATGEITVANSAALDFETTPTFSLTVEVTDDSTPALTGSTTVTVNLNDVNEQPAPTGGPFSIDENSANGTSVGTVAANDPDAGQTHSFAITGGNTGGGFAIGAATGEITVANSAALDFETTPVFSLTVEVTDDGTPALSGSTTVTVNLTDVNEAPTAVDDAVATDEDTPITILVLANDFDPDAGDTLTIVSVAGSVGAVTNNGGDLSYDPTVAFNSLPQGGSAVDTFTYTIEDSGGLQSTASVTVTVGGLNDAPIADDEIYNAIGNTRLAVAKTGPFGEPTFASTLADVLDGDIDPDAGDVLSVVPFVGTLGSGAELDLAADGSFFYTPPAGQATPDSFTYTVQDTFGATDTGTVTINLAKMVWYVDNEANGGAPNTGSGTSTDPFSTLSDAEAASAAGHVIYVRGGDGTTANQDAGITLKDQQKLLGEAVDLIVDPDDGGPEPPATLLVGNAANRPQITNIGAAGLPDDNGVDVPATAASFTGVEIRGLDISGRDNGIDVTATGTNSVTVLISNNIVSSDATNGIEGIDVNANSTGTTTVTVSNNALGGRGNAFDARTGAAGLLRVDFNTNANVISSSGNAIVIDGSGGGNTTITGFANNSVHGDTLGSGILVTSAIFDVTPGAPFNQVSGGNTVVGASGAGNGVGASGMVLTNVAGDLAFTDLDIFASNGTGLGVSSTGALNAAGGTGARLVVGPGSIVEANGGPAVSVNNASVNLPFSTLQSTNSTTNGVSLVNAFGGVAGTALSAGAGQISDPVGASGTAVNISGGNGSVSLGIPITNTSGNAVAITGRTSDTVAFTGAISETGSGLSLTSNGGSTISFRGGLSANTGASAAFTATGGGNVEVCDENPCNAGATGLLVNTLTSTTGTALNVANTTIGANNLEFRSISSSGGSATGIILDGTGTSGGLKVKGTGTAGSGGTIANKTGADGNTSVGIGIYLNNTRNVSLARLQLNDFSNFAIRGSGVVGFDMTNTVISGSNGTNDSLDEGSVSFTNLTGTASITDSNISGGWEDNVTVRNTSGTLNRIQFTNTTIGANSTDFGDNGITLESSGAGTVVNGTIDGCTFTSARADWVAASPQTGASMDVVIRNSAFSNNHSNIGSGGSRIRLAAIGTLTYEINNNDTRDSRGAAIFVNAANSPAVVSGTISNNRIGLAAVANSGSTGAGGIQIESNGGGDHTVLVNANTIRQYNNHGILLQAGDAMGNPVTFNATVTSNTIGNPGTINSNFNGIHLNNGTVDLPSDSFTSCVDIRVNSIAGAGAGATAPNNADYRLRQRQSTTVRLPG